MRRMRGLVNCNSGCNISRGEHILREQTHGPTDPDHWEFAAIDARTHGLLGAAEYLGGLSNVDQEAIAVPWYAGRRRGERRGRRDRWRRRIDARAIVPGQLFTDRPSLGGQRITHGWQGFDRYGPDLMPPRLLASMRPNAGWPLQRDSDVKKFSATIEHAIEPRRAPRRSWGQCRPDNRSCSRTSSRSCASLVAASSTMSSLIRLFSSFSRRVASSSCSRRPVSTIPM